MFLLLEDALLISEIHDKQNACLHNQNIEILSSDIIKESALIMWKLVDGKLIHTTDISRVKFRTNISKSILKTLKTLAKENHTHINYLLETGLKEVLTLGAITFNKKTRPKDRIQYKTTYDRELLESIREFSLNNNLFVNDVIEYSVRLINVENSKKIGYKHRVER